MPRTDQLPGKTNSKVTAQTSYRFEHKVDEITEPCTSNRHNWKLDDNRKSDIVNENKGKCVVPSNYWQITPSN